MTDTPDRSRTVTWSDPRALAAEGSALSGIDALRAMRDGRLPPPPMAMLMRFQITEVEPGTVTFTCTPGEEHYNPLGVVHGGLVCTLLDTVAGCAGHTLLPAGVGYTSLEIKVSYLRPVTADTGLLTATGTVTKPGRRVLFTDAVVRNAGGDALATASSTLLVLA
ncbi:MAG TPA: PaaI family thioesterase [Naasia sp.]